ncbi:MULTISPECIES: hypothetical protein [unclassified Frankia]
MPPTRTSMLLAPLPAMALVAVSAYYLGWLPALTAALTYAVQPRVPYTPTPGQSAPRVAHPRREDPDDHDCR